MRYALLFPIFVILSPIVKAQNLVPDPGFEILTEDCEGYPALVHWFNPNTASPDLFCLEGCGHILTPQFIQTAEVPATPNEGSCYVGMYCSSSLQSSIQTRDYLTTELISPLQSSESYRVSFSIARRTIFDYGVDRIGVYFSFDAPMDTGFVVMDVEPQLETQGSILTPELDWMLIEFDYIADGTERFMTIGNFRELDEMLVKDLGTSWKDLDDAYYLFDSVIVESSTSSENQATSALISFEDGYVLLTSSYELEATFLDLSGRMLLREKCNPGSSRIATQQFPSGIYIITVLSNSEVQSMKFWKE